MPDTEICKIFKLYIRKKKKKERFIFLNVPKQNTDSMRGKVDGNAEGKMSNLYHNPSMISDVCRVVRQVNYY